MKLIPNAGRVFLKSYSQRMGLVNLAVVGAYGAMPDKLQDALPTWAVITLAATLLTVGIVVRLIQQPELTEPANDAEK